MNYSFLSTWQMSLEGVRIASAMLQKEQSTFPDALCAAVRDVENNPAFHSVGYGGYPNRDGEVQMDAAYMDGSTLRFGGIAGVRDLANPIDTAYSLSLGQRNCLLCGDGAEMYARQKGFPFRNMLTGEAREHWLAAREMPEAERETDAYAGHDTVCVLGKCEENIAVAVSTSGLFMKHPGRIGDSPVIGSGFYCDSRIGGAAATGVGEDIMRGCLSFDIVRRMEEGRTPQEACEAALLKHARRLRHAGVAPGAMSVIALSADGIPGAATTLREFAFVLADQDHPAAVWLATNDSDGLRVARASEERLTRYRDA